MTPGGEPNDILAQVKANIAKLQECPKPHDFVPTEPGKLGAKYRCSKCGGDLDCVQARWYIRGLEDARKAGE